MWTRWSRCSRCSRWCTCHGWSGWLEWVEDDEHSKNIWFSWNIVGTTRRHVCALFQACCAKFLKVYTQVLFSSDVTYYTRISSLLLNKERQHLKQVVQVSYPIPRFKYFRLLIGTKTLVAVIKTKCLLFSDTKYLCPKSWLPLYKV